ncbi:hypothetical protein [Maricaulis sp.]|uniref:hypothetical protein n=1 Tax=Maricaulis sp. TaxID=1486257 RepID=UPI00261E3A57|nr:hypothetical protein [Maricaulis sp.]
MYSVGNRSAISPYSRTTTVVAFFLGLQTFVLLFLVSAILVLKTGIWPENYFGLDGANIVRHSSSFTLNGTFILLGVTITSLVLLIRRSPWVFATYTVAVVGHAAVWVSNLSNPYYHGEIGFIIFMIEVPAGILLAWDFRPKPLAA